MSFDRAFVLSLKEAFHQWISLSNLCFFGKVFLQPVCHPLLVVEQAGQMGEISVASKPIGDDNPRDYLDTLQLNPYPLTCPLTAAFEQLGDNRQPGRWCL